MRVTLLALTHTRVHVRGCKEPRFTKGGVHVFEAIARRHGIKSVSIDRNFKIGARSKKRESFLGGGLYLLREWQAPSEPPPPVHAVHAVPCISLHEPACGCPLLLRFFFSHVSSPLFFPLLYLYMDGCSSLVSSTDCLDCRTRWIRGPAFKSKG